MKVRRDTTSDVSVTNKNILIYLIKPLFLFLASLKRLLFEYRREGMGLLISSLINRHVLSLICLILERELVDLSQLLQLLFFVSPSLKS